MFGVFNAKTEKRNDDFGFTACASCTTGHTPTCDKIDAQLAQMLEIKPNDPQFKAKMAEAKRLAFGG